MRTMNFKQQAELEQMLNETAVVEEEIVAGLIRIAGQVSLEKKNGSSFQSIRERVEEFDLTKKIGLDDFSTGTVSGVIFAYLNSKTQ
jgi:hypothetical protein